MNKTLSKSSVFFWIKNIKPTIIIKNITFNQLIVPLHLNYLK